MMRRAALVALLLASCTFPASWASDEPPKPPVQAHAGLYRTGSWWPCWVVDVPCSEQD